MKKTILVCMLAMLAIGAYADEEMLKYGDFNTWITRNIHESVLVGGKYQTLYEVGPTGDRKSVV